MSSRHGSNIASYGIIASYSNIGINTKGVFIFGSFAIAKSLWQRAIAEGFVLGRVAIGEAFVIISVIEDLFLDSNTIILGSFAIAKVVRLLGSTPSPRA